MGWGALHSVWEQEGYSETKGPPEGSLSLCAQPGRAGSQAQCHMLNQKHPTGYHSSKEAAGSLRGPGLLPGESPHGRTARPCPESPPGVAPEDSGPAGGRGGVLPLALGRPPPRTLPTPKSSVPINQKGTGTLRP